MEGQFKHLNPVRIQQFKFRPFPDPVAYPQTLGGRVVHLYKEDSVYCKERST
jgi:hypothetical protein